MNLDRIVARLTHWHNAGYPAVRIWLTSEDVIALHALAHRTSTLRFTRFAGIPITQCDATPSRIVFEDGTSVGWSGVCT